MREARTVLREMGLDLPEAVASRVWDTTAETRDMVLPVRPEGPRGGARRHLLGNTAGFDATGHPAMSIPCACDEGLPIGLQLVGRYFAEADIYCAAHAFEQTTDRPDPAPAL